MVSAPQIEPGKETLPLFFGVDVGGTNIKIGLVDDHGNTVVYRKIPTLETEGPQRYMERSTEVMQFWQWMVGRDSASCTFSGGSATAAAGAAMHPGQAMIAFGASSLIRVQPLTCRMTRCLNSTPFAARAVMRIFQFPGPRCTGAT